MDLTFCLFASSMSEILSSISCILLVKLASEFLFQVPKAFISRSLSLGFLYWLHFHSQALNCFIHFLPLLVFVFICLRNVFVFSLRTSIISILAILRPLFCVPVILQYSRTGMLGLLGFNGDMLSLLFLVVFLCWCPGFWNSAILSDDICSYLC